MNVYLGRTDMKHKGYTHRTIEQQKKPTES
jgi:hypothetical protein